MSAHNFKNQIPEYVAEVAKTLENKGFESYLVGGCVRDLLMDRTPKDWDITTNATPEDIQSAFENTFYTNDFGTVGVVNDTLDQSDPAHVIEITPYRIESTYSDARRPDEVTFAQTLTEDLSRRDFTMNAIAYSVSKGQIEDPFKGQSDIKDKTIRAVGNATERFTEDALRMLRAVRLAAETGFMINTEATEAIKENAHLLKKISKERIRDELSRLIASPSPMQGVNVAHETGILQYILPELEKGIGVEQNGDHIYDVWEHNLRAVQHAADRDWPLHVRLAALLHDVAKPHTRRWSNEKNDWTFYGHDVVGGRVSRKTLSDLRFPKTTVDKVSKLVRHHLFFSDIDQITLSAVRRLVRNVGPENVWDLMKVRACDRIGMGRPKETPYRLRKYQSMIEEAMRAPVSVGMLKIDGKKIMDVTHETPGPRIGHILHALLEEVLDDPSFNTETFLVKRAGELSQLSDTELKALGEQGAQKKEEQEEAELKEIRKRHWVK